MSEETKRISELLEAPIPTSAISKRAGKGGSGKLSYLEGHYVISKLNEIFGFDGWRFRVQEVNPVFPIQKKPGDDSKFYCSVVVVGEICAGIALREDVGFGDGTGKNPSDAIEMAYKEAVTDCLKRCARQLGGALGNHLYDKNQTNVVDDSADQAEALIAELDAVSSAKDLAPIAKKASLLPDGAGKDKVRDLYNKLKEKFA